MLSDTTIQRDGKAHITRRLVLGIRKKMAPKYRKQLNQEIREKLKGVKPFTIFSNNCLGGVFYHYKNQEECIKAWRKRIERIVWDNIFIIATNHDGMCHEDCMARFDSLPYNSKIMFVSKEYPQYKWAIPIKQFKNRFQCWITTAFADMKGHRYYECAFDIAT